MPRIRQWVLFLSISMLLALSFANTTGVTAQGGNLLRDGGFDGETYRGIAQSADGTTFNVPMDWSGWVFQTPHTQEWMNLVPNGLPHTASMKRSGARSLSIDRGGATFTIAIFQEADVTPGSNLRATAWAYQENSSQAGARVRIGIDPNGSTDPLGSGIVWSGFYSTVQSWIEISIEATAIGSRATVFIYATQAWANDPNALYLDEASLVVGGAGGTAANSSVTGAPGAAVVVAAPTTVPVVPFVSAQGAREDGSIVHMVGEGDTIDSIAVAYGVTRNEILELNGLDKKSFLLVGQQLIIKPPSIEETEPAEPAADATTVVPPDEVVVTPGAVVSGEDVTPPEKTVVPTEQAPTTAVSQTGVNPEDAPPAPVIAAASGSLNPAETSALVCVLLFDDANTNRIQEDGEALLAGGKINLNTTDATIGEYETDGVSEPGCFSDLTPGDYIVTASVPEGYGLTTPDQLRLRVQPGTRLDVAFGAALGVVPVVLPPVASAPTATDEQIGEEPEDSSTSGGLAGNSGLLVFGLAAIVLIGGLGATLLLRRR